MSNVPGTEVPDYDSIGSNNTSDLLTNKQQLPIDQQSSSIQNTIQTDNFNSAPKKTKGEAGWEVVGIITGVIIIIVGIVNAVNIENVKFGTDYYTYTYSVLATSARALYGLFTISGICLVIHYAHKACKK